MQLNFGNLDMGKIDIYIYTDEHVVIPRWTTGVYGSFMKNVEHNKKSFYGKFYVRKDKVMVIDKNGLGQRCNNDGVGEPVGRCLVRKLEETFNCTTHQLTANKSKEFCQGQIGEFNVAKEDYYKTSGVDLVNKTGCLPSCNRYETSLEDTPDIRTWPAPDYRTITLVFTYEDGSYNLHEEYIVYDTSNFIADVGGYLGLLMGHSLLSIYYLSTDWMSKVKIWRYEKY